MIVEEAVRVTRLSVKAHTMGERATALLAALDETLEALEEEWFSAHEERCRRGCNSFGGPFECLSPRPRALRFKS